MPYGFPVAVEIAVVSQKQKGLEHILKPRKDASTPAELHEERSDGHEHSEHVPVFAAQQVTSEVRPSLQRHVDASAEEMRERKRSAKATKQEYLNIANVVLDLVLIAVSAFVQAKSSHKNR